MVKNRLKTKYVAITMCLLVLLLVPATVFFTLAFKTASTETIVNEFEEKEVVIEIKEAFDGAIKKDVAVNNTGDLPAYIRFKISVSVVDEAGNTVVLPINTVNTSDTVADLTNRGIDISDFTITNNDGSPWTDKFFEVDGIYYYENLVELEESVAIFDQAVFNIPVFDQMVIDLPLPLIDDDGNPYYVLNSDGELCYKFNETTGKYTVYTSDEMSTGGYTPLLDDKGTFTYMLSSYRPVLTVIAESIQAEGVADAWGVTLNEDGTIGATSTPLMAKASAPVTNGLNIDSSETEEEDVKSDLSVYSNPVLVFDSETAME